MINIPRTALYCVSAVAITAAVSSTAFAQGMAMDKMAAVPTAGQATIKTLAENEKVIVTDIVTRPGEGTPMDTREGRVSYYVTGGKIERTYADGTKTVVTRKAGLTMINTEKRPYSTRNIGTTTIHLISVKLK
jgi:hypothetical protein